MSAFVGILEAQEGGETVPSYVASVAWSPDGNRIAISRGPVECNLENQEYTVDIINMATSELLNQIPVETGCVAPSVEWNFDGTRLVLTGSVGKTATIWNMIAAPQIIVQSEALAGEQAMDLWSPDGRRLAHITQDMGAYIWESRRGATETTCCEDETGGLPISIAWSPGTANLVAGYADGQVAIWDSRDFRQLKLLSGHAASVRGVAYNLDGQKVASADMDGLIKIWDALTGELLIEFQNPAHTGIRIIEWSPAGDQVATLGEDGDIHIWDTLAGEEIGMITTEGQIYDLDWSPDGTRIVYGGEDIGVLSNYKIALAPIPFACDTTVQAADTIGLVNAINDANNSATAKVVCLTESTYLFNPETNATLFDINGFNALPGISRTVIINGNGATLERDPFSQFPFRFFHVASPGSLILTNLTLTGGAAPEGENGGAILNEGMVTILNTTFLNNRGGSGGAIYTSGLTVTISDSNFTGNIAAEDDGGAIGNGGSVVEIINTQFFDNSASDKGGAINNDPGVLNVSDSLFSFNSTGDDAGAIFSAGQLTVTGTTFHSNSSRDDGGSIRNHDTGTASISESSFQLNNAADEGGAIANDGYMEATSNCFLDNSAVDATAVAGVSPGTNIINNWWGSAGGPIPSMVGEGLIYQPFLVEDPGFCDVQ